MPSKIGAIPVSAFDVVGLGDLAYVADGGGLSITRQTQLSAVGVLDGLAQALDVDVEGAHAFVADDASLRVVDVVDPSAPVEIGSAAITSALRVAGDGDLAYVAGADGLSVIDVSDPANPVQLGQAPTTPLANKGLCVSGALAFVSGSGLGLGVVDVSDPAAPFELGTLAMSGSGGGLSVVGDLVFVADGNAGLRIIDVGDPAMPAELGSFALSGEARDVVVDGSLAYVAVRRSLEVVDVTDPTVPAGIGEIDFGLAGTFDAQRVWLSGNLVYVAAGTGLRVVDVSDPTAPVVVGVHDTPGIARSVAVGADIAYVADSNSVAGDKALRVIKAVPEPSLISLQVACLIVVMALRSRRLAHDENALLSR
jgi:hypothetical protein